MAHKNKDINIIQSVSNADVWAVILGQRLPSGAPEHGAITLLDGVSRTRAISIADNLQLAEDANKHDVCIYLASTNSIKDRLIYTQRGLVGANSKESASELLAQLPDAELLTIDQAEERMANKFVTLPVPITTAEYERLLTALPPLAQGGADESESFVMGEAIGPNIYLHVARIGKHHFKTNQKGMLSHNDLINKVRAGMERTLVAHLSKSRTPLSALPKEISSAWVDSLPAAFESKGLGHLDEGFRVAVSISEDMDYGVYFELSGYDGNNVPNVPAHIVEQASLVTRDFYTNSVPDAKGIASLVEDLAWVPGYEMGDDVDKSQPYFMDAQGNVAPLEPVEKDPTHNYRFPESKVAVSGDVIAVIYFEEGYKFQGGIAERVDLFSSIENSMTVAMTGRDSTTDQAWSAFMDAKATIENQPMTAYEIANSRPIATFELDDQPYTNTPYVMDEHGTVELLERQDQVNSDTLAVLYFGKDYEFEGGIPEREALFESIENNGPEIEKAKRYAGIKTWNNVLESMDNFQYSTPKP